MGGPEPEDSKLLFWNLDNVCKFCTKLDRFEVKIKDLKTLKRLSIREKSYLSEDPETGRILSNIPIKRLKIVGNEALVFHLCSV